VVIPTLDEAENIADCLKSLQAQTRPADEIIVVDNESKDETVEIARAYGVKVLSFPRPDIRHGSLGLVRQRGSEEARGDVIVSTDADCTYPSDWLQKIAQHFSANPKLAVLGGPVLPTDGDLWDHFLSALMNFPRSYISGWGVPYFLGGNTSFRKDAFMLTEGYKGAGGHGPIEEWVLSFRLSRAGEALWDDDLYIFSKGDECWRVYAAAWPLSTAPLNVWFGLAALQGVV